MWKKVVWLFVMTAIILILTSCGSQDGYYPEMAEEVIVAESIPIHTTTPEPVAIPEPAPQIFETWQEAYAALLRGYMGNDELTSIAFNLHDFNRNGTPELIVNGLDSDDEIYDMVYFFRHGEVLPLEFGEGVYVAEFALAGRGGTYDTHGGRPGLVANVRGATSMNAPTRIFYRLFAIEDDMLVVYARGTGYYCHDDDSRFYIDDEAVTMEEFDRVFGVQKSEHDRINMHQITEENIERIIFGWQLSPFAMRAVTEFLSGFPSLFQPAIGWHNADTGGLYGWGYGEWMNVFEMSPYDAPLIFQSGVYRDSAPENWYSDTWGVFFTGDFYDEGGRPLTSTDTPSIRHYGDNAGTLARRFTLFDFFGDGMPQIVIEYIEMGVSTWEDSGGTSWGWGYSFIRPFVIYAFSDGVYRQVSGAPHWPQGSAGFAVAAPIYRDGDGNVVLYFNDGYTGFEWVYYLRNEDGRIWPELIGHDEDAWEWWQANHEGLTVIEPWTDLQDEVTALLTRQLVPARCDCGWSYARDVRRTPTPPLTLHDINPDEEFLRQFDRVHTYTHLGWSFDWYYMTLVLTTDRPLHDFSFMSVGWYMPDAGGIFLYEGNAVYTVVEFNPGEVFVLNAAFDHYLIPRGGIAFTDADGTRRGFAIQESMAGGCFPWVLLIDIDEWGH